jgi:hypothetical protein
MRFKQEFLREEGAAAVVSPESEAIRDMKVSSYRWLIFSAKCRLKSRLAQERGIPCNFNPTTNVCLLRGLAGRKSFMPSFRSMSAASPV